jgi:acetylglutamate kinase
VEDAVAVAELDRPVITVKIGGKMAEEEGQLRSFAADLLDLLGECYLLLVHGGGAEVSRISRQLGFEPIFHEGIRITCPDEMDVVEMILSGKVNKRLVRLFQTCGLPAVGLCGADGRVFTGRSLGRVLDIHTRTGNVAAVSTELLTVLLRAGYFPVLSSTSADEEGKGVNINADTVAFELACALSSASLVFLSDIPGVLKDGQVLGGLDRDSLKAELASGTISGGMIPKVTSALEALKSGVGQVVIGQYCGRGSLDALLRGGMGTRLRL